MTTTYSTRDKICKRNAGLPYAIREILQKDAYTIPDDWARSSARCGLAPNYPKNKIKRIHNLKMVSEGGSWEDAQAIDSTLRATLVSAGVYA